MTRRLDVAIIGADSIVGGALLELLADRQLSVGEIHALAQAPERTATVEFAGQELDVEDATQFEFSQVQLAFLAVRDPEMQAVAERAADDGCMVVDASGTRWQDADIPTVVPELNAGDLEGFNARGIVANPDPLAVVLAVAMQPLCALAPLERLTATAMVPVSDLGRPAFEDLARETTALLNARSYERRHFSRQIAFNVHGQVGAAGAGGQTEREQDIGLQLQRLLDAAGLGVALTLVPAPVFYGYGIAVEVQFESPVELAQAQAALQASEALNLIVSLDDDDCPTPVTDATVASEIHLARLREGSVAGRTLAFWLTADNVRRAAALNALKNAQILIRDYL
ncbi:MAG: aspartate-semialdehyde dehydrogenase [Nevskiales bacterium]|nr:aspartate-semialdehyde dehydrogenase [Nevskiales bacterium]